MGIAFDAFVDNGVNSNSTFSWTHTPAGTPKGIVVGIIGTNTSTDSVTGVTYGGQAMTQITGSPRTHSAGADDSVINYFLLGSSVPTGNQTVEVTLAGGSSNRRAVSVSLTTDGGDVVLDATAGNDSGAGTNNGGTVTIATTASTDTVCLFLFHSGEAAVGSNSTNVTNMFESDFGQQTASFDRADGAGGNVSATLTVSSDSWHGFGAAFKEGTSAQTVSPALLSQAGATFSPQANLTFSVGLINQAGQTFAPQANLSLTPGLINQAGQTFSPQANLAFSPGLINQAGVVFDPTVTSGLQTVEPGLINQAGQTFAPQANLFATPGLIDRSGATFDPAVQPGAVTVSPALIDRSGVTFDPQVNLSLSPGLINQTGVIFDPEVQPGGVTVTPELISQVGVVFQPSVSVVGGGGGGDEFSSPVMWWF